MQEGRIVVEGCRGSSAWERPGQAAELAVRTATGEYAAEALTVVRTEGAAPRWEVTVAHTDGRMWRVVVAQGAAAAAPPGELRGVRTRLPGADGRGGGPRADGHDGARELTGTALLARAPADARMDCPSAR